MHNYLLKLAPNPLFLLPATNQTQNSPTTKPKPTICSKNQGTKAENGKTKRDEKQYWLLKTEPGEWSSEDQASNGGISNWDGVKNHQALKNLKSMRLNDLCFFYHSGTKSRRVVGVVSVVREWYEDDDVSGGAVDLKAVGEMRRMVDLKEMKGELKNCKEFGLFRQPRLSVVPVPVDVWERICELGNGYEGDGVIVSDGEQV